MKSLIKYTLAISLAAGASAGSSHHHLHRHAKKNAGSKVDKRADIVVDIVATATATVYQLGGEVIAAAAAEAGLADGEYIIVGESTPTYLSSALPTATIAQKTGAQFIESKASPTSAPSSSTASTPPSSVSAVSSTPSNTPSSSSAASTAAQPKQSGSSSAGINAPFPSGTIKCSDFPSAYGAVGLDWLGFGGWTGIQKVPGYAPGASSISTIVTGVAGDSCSPGDFCSYACPIPQQMAQWPTAQGSQGQSVGGLFCDANGYLELTRPGVNTLCQSGAGGVSVQNDLNQTAVACFTQYPGTESMVIPVPASPGESLAILNSAAATSYVWNDMYTTIQYYLNNQGLTVEEACIWQSPTYPTTAGNWAPMIMGVGQDINGVTWLSLFPNAPTSTAILNFNVEIIGDVSSTCSFEDGQWTGGSNGCTTSVTAGGTATIRYYN